MIGLKGQNVVLRAVLARNLLWDALRPVERLLALLLVLPWEFHQVCSNIVLYFGKFATIHYEPSFPDAVSDGPCLSEADDVSTEAEVRRSRKRRHAVITRRLVPLAREEPGPKDFGSHERSRVLLEQAFDDGIVEFK